MSKTDKKAMTYESREELEKNFETAVNDILSAEREAKSIADQADETVRELSRDAAVREREMREAHRLAVKSMRAEAIAAAVRDGEKQAEQIRSHAQKAGDELVAQKQKQIQESADELFAAVGG